MTEHRDASAPYAPSPREVLDDLRFTCAPPCDPINTDRERVFAIAKKMIRQRAERLTAQEFYERLRLQSAPLLL